MGNATTFTCSWLDSADFVDTFHCFIHFIGADGVLLADMVQTVLALVDIVLSFDISLFSLPVGTC